MKRQIQISVHSPCQEQWSSFHPTSRGGFCGSCQKEVIDFSTWDDDRLKAYLKTEKRNVCGRFKEEQLKVYTYDKPQPLNLKWMPLFLTTMLLLFSKPVLAQRQKSKPKTEQGCLERIGEVDSAGVPFMTISGIVTDKKGVGIPGVNVVRKGTPQGVYTDAEGKYVFEIPTPMASEILVFTYVAYATSEVCVSSKTEQTVSVCLTFDAMILGDLEYHTISPRGWWRSFKDLFR